MSETTTTTINFNTSKLLYFLSPRHYQRIFSTSFLALLVFSLLTYNGFTIFYVRLPSLSNSPPEPANFWPENGSGVSATTRIVSSSSSSSSSATATATATKLSSSVMYSVKEETPPVNSKTQISILKKSNNLVLPVNNISIRTLKRARKSSKHTSRFLQSEARSRQFSTRMKDFLGGNGSNSSSSSSSSSSCKVPFFMTWISSLDSFGDREILTIESLFKSHPDGCLIIVSKSMDSKSGLRLLSPFVEKGFRVTAMSPDFDYIFKDTFAEQWFNKLKKGNVDPGEVALGQNLSNLLRLSLLYKYGGIYIDTDVIILKSLTNLRNVIGAQTIDLETGNWSRLNNAVLIFDKKHPLLYKFIQEFALTFDGNKWGHNGPYLVSRVVSRVTGRPGFDFEVLPPSAFYPVDWSRIHRLFQAHHTDENHTKWVAAKLKHIREKSFAVHLWNRQSRKLKVEDGSVISHILSDCCVFCNSSKSAL